MNLQNWYRKQGVVEVICLIIVTCSGLVLASCGSRHSALVSEPQPRKGGRTFADWCQVRENLIPEARQTVKALLERVTDEKYRYAIIDCDAANQKLLTLKFLQLGTSDLRPLESLTNLTELDLGGQLSDIKPLASLTKLIKLNLKENKISDIKPLASLTNLT